MAPGITRDHLKAEVGRFIKWGYAVQKNGAPALEAEAANPVLFSLITSYKSEPVLKVQLLDKSEVGNKLTVAIRIESPKLLHHKLFHYHYPNKNLIYQHD